MGILTLASFRGELTLYLRNRSDAAVSTARLDRWINVAYQHMSHPSVRRFRELEVAFNIPLVTNVNTYDVNTAAATDLGAGTLISAVYSVAHHLATTIAPTNQKRRLRPRQVDWFDERTIPSGQPTTYLIEGANIEIMNTPSAQENNQLLRLRGWRIPALLTQITDTTALNGLYWDEVLIVGSQWMAERALGNFDRAETVKQDYVGLINELQEQEQLEGRATGWEASVVVEPTMPMG